MAGLVGEANMAFANGDDAKAAEYLLTVIKECPDAPDPFLTLGLIYENRNQPEVAIEYLMIAAHLIERDPAVWKRCANIWRDLHDDHRAIFCYGRAIKFYDSKAGGPAHDFDSMWQRIQLYKNIGDYKKGVDALLTLLKLRPNDPDATKELARMYHSTGQLEQAEQLLEQQFKRMRTAVDAGDETTVVDLDVVNMYAEVQISMGHYAESCSIIQWAQQAYKATLENPFPLDLLYALAPWKQVFSSRNRR